MVQDKKQEFSDGKRNKGLNLVVVGIVILIVAGLAVYFLSGEEDIARGRYTPGDFNTGAAFDYGTVTPMTQVENHLDGDKVILSLQEVEAAGLIYSQVPVGDSYMPITSFIAPSGRLVVAFSICEPCRSETFRIDGVRDQIICESCGTIWTMEPLVGVSGGCLDHPPEEIYYEVLGDEIQIPFQQIKDWKPREF
ncbi:hypothetical protein BHU72_14325 [Desulfuribacillus stibiiarsenatis]|uniref:Membrane iron-sulfur containing protein FtrD-like domain-containing protein n=1 Tax=Desulfuribacillus stibiiarsenatis TaxID=1390249 RepID=A0A1E5L7Y3_9FIRM|nr:Fe-S-containing protein [Desulfuribacillus stibiiarsenatis]OEH86099.1 hypothetical protein BHU72_14325 [Desulfuribacillus stibiiarsenatis]